RGALKDVLLYYCDYGYEGDLELGGARYRALLTDGLATGDFRGKAMPADVKDPDSWSSGVRLKVDVNGNGTYDNRGEDFDGRRPSNIKGTTYEIDSMSPIGSSFRIARSKTSVPEIPTPPDHSVGKPVTAFDAERTDGTTVHFPADYKGKVVMLDFWAT